MWRRSWGSEELKEGVSVVPAQSAKQAHLLFSTRVDQINDQAIVADVVVRRRRSSDRSQEKLVRCQVQEKEGWIQSLFIFQNLQVVKFQGS